MKSQSAMEYLMTYGWAILIIAVVLGVLFQLGVFSGSALTPKAAPGACQVVRLGGQASLEGECQGQLPQYVAYFNGNGQTSYMDVPSSSSTTLQGSFTYIAWVDLNKTSQEAYEFAGDRSNSAFTLYVYTDRTAPGILASVFETGHIQVFSGQYSFTFGTWHQIGEVFNGVTVSVILDGQILGPGPANSISPNSGGLNIDQRSLHTGNIANMQLYNTSLTSNEVLALYREGVGGAPIKIQNIDGWWPLNGNAQDYSGNNDNGQIGSGVSFNGTWQSGYTPP
jgi:hypothetical protein